MNFFNLLSKYKSNRHSNNRYIKSSIPATKFKHVYLVIGIKGGVGKSTISYAIASGLSLKHKTAIIDCDIESSNLKDFMNLSNSNMSSNINFSTMGAIKINNNLYASGMSVFDSDYINKSIYTNASQLRQFINDFILYTRYGSLESDYCIIDVPAGSSDIMMAIIESFKRINQTIDGVIVVTQPNTITDFNRALDLSSKLGLEVLYVVINMHKAVSKHAHPVICSCGCGEEFIPFNNMYDKMLSNISNSGIDITDIYDIPLMENANINHIAIYLSDLIDSLSTRGV